MKNPITLTHAQLVGIVQRFQHHLFFAGSGEDGVDRYMPKASVDPLWNQLAHVMILADLSPGSVPGGGTRDDGMPPHAGPHTPAPWTASTTWVVLPGEQQVLYVHSENETVAQIWMPVYGAPLEDRKQAGEANARLIAAAPAMLAALRQIKTRVCFIGHPGEPMSDNHPDWSKELAMLESAVHGLGENGVNPPQPPHARAVEDMPLSVGLHSRSPWVAWYDKNDEGFIYQAGVDTNNREANICVTTCDNVIGHEWTPESYNSTIIADTQLLAAAPELLKALRSAVTWTDEYNRHHVDDGLLLLSKQMHAAIDKATGEPATT